MDPKKSSKNVIPVTNTKGIIKNTSTKVITKKPPSKTETTNKASIGKEEIKGNQSLTDQKRFTAHKFDPHKQANILSTSKKHHT